jgi:hypothetical protein
LQRHNLLRLRKKQRNRSGRHGRRKRKRLPNNTMGRRLSGFAKGETMKVTGLVAALVLFAASNVSAAQFGGVEEVSASISPQYFQWEESIGGKRLLREQGWLVGAGAQVRVDLLKTEAGSLMLKGKAELFGGVVDYDGQTQPPNPFPVKTDVTYIGARGETDLGWRFPVQKVSIEPFAGIGYRWWLRDLHDSTAFDPVQGRNVPVGGYTEYWQTVYARLGAHLDYSVSDTWKLFWEAGAKYPFYNSNTVAFTDVGEKTIRPENAWSAFAEVGARYKRFRPSMFYEGFRYSQSPLVAIGGNRAIYQPKSDSDIVGISLGWAFM